MSDKKKIVIIAGPNGAGKTTFALEFLPNEADCPVFVNADLIAVGLAPFTPEEAAFRAGRLMLKEIALIGCDGILLAITCYTFIGSREANQKSQYQQRQLENLKL